ncbi:alpha/beta fold hydrolase [Lentzea sp. NBRC 102530]|uniref:MBL fold metallo-hydrolase n=1 Tax=Lentzea sp. NBRC 102530 TaxID=3032201 RepID=UPI0024A0CDCA|nr:alpha/beta fold hydrolase [Lentzea sp. NBRC 102530]GLY53757.1 hypothetical protein Lesp01_74130 [Lentzea sp. NBRC 102530]
MKTIVLVHGFWVTPRSWEHWIDRYQKAGYQVVAPAYPGFEVEVEALNADPSPIEPGDLPPIDAVLLTHDHHADNLDDAGRALLPTAGTVVTTASGARRLGNGARGLLSWETTRLTAPGRPAIEITATPCRHGPPLSRPVTGDVIGFALRWDGQSTAGRGSPATPSCTTEASASRSPDPCATR